MTHSANGPAPAVSNIQLLLGYVADLELEVDRLRKQGQFVQHEVRGTLHRIRQRCSDRPTPEAGAPPLAEVEQAARQLAAILSDLQESPGYHPAYDQVLAIALRPLVEKVFRWQQRLVGAAQVVLRMELGSEHMEWFPARLRHILDNLFSNCLKHPDPSKSESWVHLGLRVSEKSYELRVSDNGVGLPAHGGEVFDLFYRAAPARAAGLGVGLPVVKLLVERSGGTLTADSAEGQGAAFTASLPRFDLDDFLL